MAIIVWITFFWLHRHFGGEPFDFNKKFIAGIILYPVGWAILYHLWGTYRGIYYKSRLIEVLSTFFSTFVGCIIVFTIFILYKKHQYLSSFYGEFVLLFALQFCLTYLSRFLLLSKAHSQLQREDVWFNTLIIGSHQKSMELLKALINNK